MNGDDSSLHSHENTGVNAEECIFNDAHLLHTTIYLFKNILRWDCNYSEAELDPAVLIYEIMSIKAYQV